MVKTHSSVLKALDYLFVLRPMLFYPGWSTFLAGYFIAQKKELFFTPAQWYAIGHLQIGILFLLFAAAMGGSFLLNQLQDKESDRRNNKLFIISEGHIPVWAGWLEALLLILASTGAAFYFSRRIGILILLFNLLTGYLYNFKPFEMKNHPWRSLFANGLMGWLAFALGWAVFFPLGIDLIWASLPYIFLNTALYLYTTLPDVGGDQATEKNTLSVRFALPPILYAAFLLFMLSFFAAIITGDYTALVIDLLSLPFFMHTLWEKNVGSAVRTTKFTIFFFAAVICLKWPFYLLLMAAGFFFTHWYFNRRFGFDYPNFR